MAHSPTAAVLAIVAMLALFAILPTARGALAAPVVVDQTTPPSSLPQGPCGVEPFPNYPALDAPPELAVWTDSELGAQWSPPPCTGWQTTSANVVVGLAGHIHDARDADAMLTQIGAVSTLRGLTYWSVTDKRWNALFVRATALDGPNPHKLRKDFSSAEMRVPADRYFLGADNRSGDDTVWRLRIKEVSEQRIVVETANVTPLGWAFLPVIGAGDVQTDYFLERAPDKSWRIYTLTRVAYLWPLIGTFAPRESYANRALGFYRHFAGAQ